MCISLFQVKFSTNIDGHGREDNAATHASIFDNDEVKTALVTGATGLLAPIW